ASAIATADTRASSARCGTKVMAPTRLFWNSSAARRFSTRKRKSARKPAPRRPPKPRRLWKRPKLRHRPKVLRQNRPRVARRKNKLSKLGDVRDMIAGGFDKKLRSSGTSNILWGTINLLIGTLAISQSTIWRSVSLTLGLGLLVAGLYVRTVRDPK